MKKTRHLHRRKKHLKRRTRKHRGGGGCFGGICSSNKMLSQVEQPGQGQFNFNNPLHLQTYQKQLNAMEKKSKENKAKANANLKAILNEVAKVEKVTSKPLKLPGTPTNAELEEEFRQLGLNAGTGLEAGHEVNANSVGLAELEEWIRQENAKLAQEGGGGCFGGLCSSNKMVSAVEEPTSAPATVVVNPIQTEEQQIEQLRSLVARKVEIEAEIAKYTQEAIALKSTNREAAIHKLKLRKMAEQRLQRTDVMIYNTKVMIVTMRKLKAATAAKKVATRRRKNRRRAY